MSQKGSNKAEKKEEKSPNLLPKLLRLFDEHWFFDNALHPNQRKLSTIEENTTSRRSRKLQRTPSLPPPRVDQGEEQVAANSNTKAGRGRKLAYSFSCLDSPQQAIASSSTCSLSSSSSSSSTVCSVHFSETGGVQKQSKEKEGPMRAEPTRRRCANPHFAMCWEGRHRMAFQSRKWSSFSDLEVMELQGFKDLGFVFEDGGTVSSSLVAVVPGLRAREEEEEDAVKERRPCLSETWFIQRSAPPMVLRRLGRRSAEEMKEDLRVWARAVACYIRKEC